MLRFPHSFILIEVPVGPVEPGCPARSRELLEQFDLTGFARRQVCHYSGGMRHRLDLAASLVGSPGCHLLGRADNRP
jgi:ABC-type nitrate/sulfonate/bicarbonate transport system ATPase subunit